MADASLEYALRIDKRAALNDVEDFIAKANKKLGKIKTPDLSGGSSGGSNHGYSVGSKAGADVKKEAKSWEELSEAIDGASEATKELTAEDKRLVKALKELEPAQKKYVSGSKDVVKAVQKQSDEERKAASKRVDLFDAIAEANEKHRAEEAAAEAAAYKDRVKMQAAEAKARQSLEAQKNAILAQATRFRIQKGIESTEQQKALEMQLTAIVEKAGTERVSALKEEMRTRLVEFRKGMQQQQKTQAQLDAEAANRENAKAKNWGRASLIGFQVQQSIEDFQFAGMRGAANNIALMAARLGGPAGLIALAGLAGYQLKGMYDVWKNGDKDLQEAIRGTDSYINRLKELRDLQKDQRETGRELRPAENAAERIEQTTDFGFAKHEQQIAKKTLSEMKLQEEVLTNLYSTRKKIAEIDKKYSVTGVLLSGLTNLSNDESGVEQHKADMETRKRLLEEASRLEENLRQQRVFVPSLEGQDWEQQKADLTEIRKTHQETVEAAEEDLKTAAKKTRELDKQVLISGHLHAEMKRRVDLQKKLEGLDLSDEEQEALDNAEAKLSRFQQLYGLQIMQTDKVAEEAEILERMRSLLDGNYAAELRIAEAAERRASAIQAAETALDKTIDAANEAARAAERAADAEERKADSARKAATALRDQARSSRQQFEGTEFEAQRSLARQRGEAQLERALKASEANLRRRFRSQFGRGTPDQNRHLEQLINDRAEKIRQATEKAAEAADRKLIAARERQLAQQAQSALQGAEAAGRSGNAEAAAKMFAEGRSLLQELQSIQSDLIGSASIGASEAALDKIRKTQELIEQSLHLEASLQDQAAAKAERAQKAQEEAAKAAKALAEEGDGLEIVSPKDQQKVDDLNRQLTAIQEKIAAIQKQAAGGLLPAPVPPVPVGGMPNVADALGLNGGAGGGGGAGAAVPAPVNAAAERMGRAVEEGVKRGAAALTSFVERAVARREKLVANNALDPAARAESMEQRRAQLDAERRNAAIAAKEQREAAAKEAAAGSPIASRAQTARERFLEHNKPRLDDPEQRAMHLNKQKRMEDFARQKAMADAERGGAAQQKMQQFAQEKAMKLAEHKQVIQNEMKLFAERQAMLRAEAKARMEAISAEKKTSAMLDDFKQGPSYKGPKPKAAGGYVSKGNPYVVGEAGMELFIPSQNGRIATALETRQMLQSIGLPAAMAAISQHRNPSPVSSSINNRFGEINVNLHGSTVSDMKNALLSEAKAQGLRRG